MKKKIIIIVIVFLLVLLTGSSTIKDSNCCNDVKGYGETFEEKEIEITFSSCEYKENYTKAVFKFKHKKDVEYFFRFQTVKYENYEGRKIKPISITINGEERLYKNSVESENNEVFYYLKPLEEGEIIVIYDEYLEGTLDFSLECEYQISMYGYYMAFRDNRMFINDRK